MFRANTVFRPHAGECTPAASSHVASSARTPSVHSGSAARPHGQPDQSHGAVRRVQQAEQQAAEPGWRAGPGWQSEAKAGGGDSHAIAKGRGVPVGPGKAGGFDEDAQDSGPQSTLSIAAQTLRPATPAGWDETA